MRRYLCSKQYSRRALLRYTHCATLYRRYMAYLASQLVKLPARAFVLSDDDDSFLSCLSGFGKAQRRDMCDRAEPKCWNPECPFVRAPGPSTGPLQMAPSIWCHSHEHQQPRHQSRRHSSPPGRSWMAIPRNTDCPIARCTISCVERGPRGSSRVQQGGKGALEEAR